MRFFKKMRFLPLGVNFMVVDFWGNGVFFFTPVDYIFGVSLYWKIYPRTITLPQLASNGSYSSREQPPTPYRIYTLDITLETWVISESCVCRWVVVLHGGMSPGSAIFFGYKPLFFPCRKFSLSSFSRVQNQSQIRRHSSADILDVLIYWILLY